MALGEGPVAEMMKGYYAEILNMSSARDYRYVSSLKVTFCDINTTREQSFSFTHEAKYEKRKKEIFVDLHVNEEVYTARIKHCRTSVHVCRCYARMFYCVFFFLSITAPQVERTR